jgi:hypothetical protein
MHDNPYKPPLSANMQGPPTTAQGVGLARPSLVFGALAALMAPLCWWGSQPAPFNDIIPKEFLIKTLVLLGSSLSVWACAVIAIVSAILALRARSARTQPLLAITLALAGVITVMSIWVR